MSAGELEEMAATADILPTCPVKVAEYEKLKPFGPVEPIAPVPVDESARSEWPDPRWRQYRVC